MTDCVDATSLVQISGLPANCDLDLLKLCLENPKYQGGAVQHLRHEEDDVIIQFESDDVATRFANQCVIRLPKSICSTPVEISMYSQSEGDQNSELHGVFITNVPRDIDKECLLLYLEKGGHKVRALNWREDGVVVKFQSREAAEQFCEGTFSLPKSLCSAELTVELL